MYWNFSIYIQIHWYFNFFIHIYIHPSSRWCDKSSKIYVAKNIDFGFQNLVTEYRYFGDKILIFSWELGGKKIEAKYRYWRPISILDFQYPVFSISDPLGWTPFKAPWRPRALLQLGSHATCCCPSAQFFGGNFGLPISQLRSSKVYHKRGSCGSNFLLNAWNFLVPKKTPECCWSNLSTANWMPRVDGT